MDLILGTDAVGAQGIIKKSAATVRGVAREHSANEQEAKQNGQSGELIGRNPFEGSHHSPPCLAVKTKASATCRWNFWVRLILLKINSSHPSPTRLYDPIRDCKGELTSCQFGGALERKYLESSPTSKTRNKQ
jgi:hypothetical protein